MPIKLSSDWESYEQSKHTIIDTASNVALLNDRTVLTHTGLVNVEISENDRLISQSGGWIISASVDGNLSLNSQNNGSIVKHFNLNKSVAGASVSGNDLAITFADNEIALYDIETKNILFKEQGSKFVATDSRIVNPFFMRGLVLFPTLDGKVIFVNNAKKKRLRTVIVSSEDNFNNIIAFELVQNKIIAATSYKILSMAKKEIRVKYEIRNIIYDEDKIFIATKQGEVISLTPDLQVESKVKFPFAHFYAMVSNGDKLYVLEKEGYLIVLDKKSFDYTVHEVDFDDGFVFTSNKSFFVNDKQIITE
ncbi:Putative lipoprotein [hydrothermal vent metagenome]|uniref:Putative lipoprotein n=1 Tax=hydrothermal vent metagenome TaxID=652676 RepID=A0A1W1CI86_9ZZZZ